MVFYDAGMNSSSMVPTILKSFTRHCCVYQRVYEQKLVSVVCEEVAD